MATIASKSAALGQPTDSVSFAGSLDAEDPLREHRASFHFPKREDGTPFLYFCGNSLGLQHVDVEGAMQQELTKWRDQAVEGHFRQPNPWFEIDDVLRGDMAEIVGAAKKEVVLMNTLTANLHLLLSAFYRPSGERRKILCERFPFPSDMHALVSQVETHGLSHTDNLIEIASDVASPTPAIIHTADILAALEEHKDTACVLLLGAVHFITGQFFDIATITAAAKKYGILVGIDCAHAVGNVPLQLHDWGVDFACWCTYKYLNGGPGNIGGLFVHADHTSDSGLSHLRGWWGHQRSSRFGLHREFTPSDGAACFQLSNPGVMGMMSLAPSLGLAAKIGMPALRTKSLLLTGYLEHLVTEYLKTALLVISPNDPEARGAQLSVRIIPGRLKTQRTETEAYECGTDVGNDSAILQQQLLEHGVMCDNRPPDVIRLAPVPTYNSFEDVRALVEILRSLFLE